MKSYKFLVPLAALTSNIASAYAKPTPLPLQPEMPADNIVLHTAPMSDSIAVHSGGEVFDFVLKRAETGALLATSHISHRSHSSHFSHRSGI